MSPLSVFGLSPVCNTETETDCCLLPDPSGAMEALVHGGMSPGGGRFVSHSLADPGPS